MRSSHRRCHTFQWFLLLAVAGLIVCPLPASASARNASLSAEILQPSLVSVVTGTTHNTTVIRIQTDGPCFPVIQYSNASWFAGHGTYENEVTGISSCASYVFSLTDLEPQTRYYYRVNGCGEDEKTRSFATFPVTGTCSFVVYGDTREQVPLYTQTERHKVVADRIAEEEGILFVINSGDLVADSDDSAEWSRFFNSTEKLMSRTTYIAVPGNHDQDRARFRDLTGMTGPYFFDCGNTRILLLDSTDNAYENLTEQAARVSSSFGSYEGAKVVILHHPLFTSDEKHFGGWENLQNELVPAFRKSGVRLVFSSHVHAFEQVERESITYITEARGGAPAYPLNITRVPGSVRAFENTLGYSRITVNPKEGTILTEVIRVADVSPDLRTIIAVYPEGTVDARIRFFYGSSPDGFLSVKDLIRKKDIFSKWKFFKINLIDE